MVYSYEDEKKSFVYICMNFMFNGVLKNIIYMKKNHFGNICLFIIISQIYTLTHGQIPVDYNSKTGRIKIQDRKGNLVLNIDCRNKCVIDYVKVLDNTVVTNRKGVCSSIKSNGKVYTTRSRIISPKVISNGDSVIIDGIIFGKKGNQIYEKWIFLMASDYIDWTIERTFVRNMTLEDTGFPEWSFNSMDSWTGALLGTGGVAWCKFFDNVNASLGNHTGKVTFWNQENKACLGIDALPPEGKHVAVRFSRQRDDRFTLNYSVSEDELRTKHFLARFIIDRQDIWDSFDAMGTTVITYRLRALNYDDVCYRGDFKGLSTESVRSVLNTIARVGVIDEKLMGSNNWHLDMGFVCLHEQWIAQMGLAIDDPDYLDNYRKTLDYFRDNAISKEGNVKDRWAYRIWDSEPGTFENGFYECQWGDLFDANTDYVINVAELFQINGNKEWVESHKSQCENVLGFLLAGDSDNNGLIEVFATSHNEKKGSDWIDVIWASWENAFINAKFYYALTQWADVEEITGDLSEAQYYRDLAEKCKYRFNQPVTNGGFWNPKNKWYVYWRDKDGSIHGDNLVTPVNFMAIAYGICDDMSKKRSVLSKIEDLMQKEKLFMWPISFFPYQPDEGSDVNYPFPNYENGDIFLAWGEVGIRAYQDYDPSIPVKYITNVLTQYEKDGLAFQRYDRLKQQGTGNDILANNCLPVVGLYRDIYGIQPRYNRLYLEPHMTAQLNGTLIKYRMRNQDYSIKLSMNNYSMSSNFFTISSSSNFSMNTSDNRLFYFNGKNADPSMILTRDKQSDLLIKVLNWNNEKDRKIIWMIVPGSESVVTDYNVFMLKPGKKYQIIRNGKLYKSEKSDPLGKLHFSCNAEAGRPELIEISQSE
jgi:hypothetical protein